MNTLIGGYFRDREDNRDALFSWSNRPLKSVPIKKSVNLWLPDMKIVGQRGNSCTGMAGAYAARAAIAHSTGKDPGELSGMFLYFTGRAVWDGELQDDGSYLRTLFEAWEKQGVCLEELFPRDTDPFQEPGWGCVKNAFKHRGIRNYRRIYTPDQAREALSEGIPLVGGWEVGEDFEAWRGGAAFNRETRIVGGHALAVLGYAENGDFLLPNSWEEDVGEAGWWRVTEEFLMASNRLWAADTRRVA